MIECCEDCDWLEINEEKEDGSYEYYCKSYHCIIVDPEEEMECDSYKPNWQ